MILHVYIFICILSNFQFLLVYKVIYCNFIYQTKGFLCMICKLWLTVLIFSSKKLCLILVRSVTQLQVHRPSFKFHQVTDWIITKLRPKCVMFKTVFFKSIDNYGSRITRSSRWITQGIYKNLELNKIPAEMIFISVRCRKHITLIQTKFKDQGLRWEKHRIISCFVDNRQSH